MPIAKKKLVDILISNLLYIHDDIKEVLDIDNEIGNCFLDKKDYKTDEIKLLNFRLFLAYITYVSNDVEKKVNAFKLANVRTFKTKIAMYKDAYNHMKSITKVSDRNQKAVEGVYESVVEVRLKLNSIFADLVREEKYKLFRNSLILDGIFATIYSAMLFAVVASLQTKLFLFILIVYGFIIIHESLRRYYKVDIMYLKNLANHKLN